MDEGLIDSEETTEEAILPQRLTVRQIEVELVPDSLRSGPCAVCGSPEMIEIWEQKGIGYRFDICLKCQERLFLPSSPPAPVIVEEEEFLPSPRRGRRGAVKGG